MNLQKLLAASLALVAFVGGATAAEPRIDSSKAAFYVGQEAMVCGKINEIKPFSKGTYLNMGPAYPNQHITVVIWTSDEHGFYSRFGGLNAFRNSDACARGLIEVYKNKLQIKVTNPQFLRLMK